MNKSLIIFGIVNITSDSFSDGGRYLAPDAAIAQARKLMAEGADVIDLGPASSNPDAAPLARRAGGIGGAERNRKNSLTAHSGYFSIFALHQKTEGTSIESN